ncbi:MAG: hypothetical protein U0075_07025 [Thermomicrobiales bacterium]
MRPSLRIFTVVVALVVVLPLMLPQGEPASGMQESAATPTAVGIPGIDPSATAHLGGTIPGDPKIQLVKVADGFSTPTNIAFPPDDSGRIFVVELDGRVHTGAHQCTLPGVGWPAQSRAPRCGAPGSIGRSAGWG